MLAQIVKRHGQIHRADAWGRELRPDNIGEIPSGHGAICSFLLSELREVAYLSVIRATVNVDFALKRA